MTDWTATPVEVRPQGRAGAGSDGYAAFPVYSDAERRADAVVHILGVSAALVGGAWLLAAVAGEASTLELLALAVYSAGLAGTLTTSALYHMTPPGWWKERFRRADHAMIFIMIAGSYTPLSLTRLADGGGPALCAGVWAIAMAGVAFKLLYPRRMERVSIALYLGLGWAMLMWAPTLIRAVSDSTALLILAGAIVYTVGVVFHMRGRAYANVAWHALVLVGAACHFAAMTVEFVP